MAVMKRALLLAALLTAVVLPGPAGASGTPCRNKIFNDWYRDGKIASTYPIGCYRDALKHVQPDAAIYSSLADDVRAAMRAAMRRSHGLTAPKQVGHGPKALGAGAVKGTVASVVQTVRPPKRAVAKPEGVIAAASGAPLPILLLGGLALALIAAGAIGAGVRHIRSRR
jgi:hypothetical protein